jgi:hypothetical protein
MSVSYYDSHLRQQDVPAAQKEAYLATSYPLFNDQRTPNFSAILSILKYFEHRGYVFQPTPPVISKHDFEESKNRIEGKWVGLFTYLPTAEIVGWLNGDPDVVKANYYNYLQDYPVEFKIQISKSKCPATSDNINNGLLITGEGVNSGSCREIYLPERIAGRDMNLSWRITFVKTLPVGMDDWDWPMIFDGIYCPGNPY